MSLCLPRTPIRLFAACFISILAGFSIVSVSLPCFAKQAAGTNDSRTEKVRAFHDALQPLANKTGLVIVAEGVPLIDTILESQYAELIQGGDERTSLPALAAAFDYECIRKRPNLYVLVKRYSDPRDMPGVMPEELQASLKDILRLLDPFAPQIGTFGNLAREVYAALTPEQIAAMKQEQLTVAMLQPQQRRVIRKAVDYFAVGWKADSFRSGEGWLEQALSGSLCNDTALGKEMIGYRFPYPTPQSERREFRPLGPKSVEPAITTVPKVEPTEWAERFNKAETLEALCRRLSRMNGAVTFEVKPELKDKPITIVQGAKATLSPEGIASAVADAYGLSIQRSGTRITIRRSAPLIVKDASQLAGAARALIPAPLRRALRIREIDPKTRRIFSGSPSNPPRYSEYEIDENARLLGREATRFLTLTFNEELRRRAERGTPLAEIPLSQLDGFSRAALTAILSFEPFASAGPFLTSPPEVPRYVAEFDNLIISGNQFERRGKTQISFHLGLRDPATGKFVRYVGVNAAPAIDPTEAAKGKP